MTFLPILERELRVSARRRGIYWIRCAVAFVGLLICLPQLLAAGPVTPLGIGRYVFDIIVGAALVLSCAACLITADAISSERREGTLGLLFLTRVKALDVLLGKFGSTGLSCLGAMVAFLPILMLPLLAGGVTGGEAVRKGLVLVLTLVLSLAAGLYASAFTTERFKAARIAAFIVLLVLFVPLSALSSAGDISYRVAPGSFWIHSLSLFGFACALLLGAALELRRWLSEKQPIPDILPLVTQNLPFTLGKRRGWLSRRNELGPVEWLVCSQRGIKTSIWTAAAIAFIAPLGMMWLPRLLFFRTRLPWLYMLQVPSLTLGILYAALMAWAASRFFIERRRTGELELLRTTPLGAAVIVSEQWKALKGLFAWPLSLMAFGYLFPLLAIFPMGRYLPAWYHVSVLLSFVNLFVGIGAVCWLGMWFGWTAQSQAGALAWTVALVEGIPLLIRTLGSALVTPVFRSLGIFLPGGPSLLNAVGFWLTQLVVLVFYLRSIRFARTRLSRALESEPRSFSLEESLRNAKQDAVATFRKARHWTPS